MAAGVNRRIWPNAFVCLQKVHRLSKLIGLGGPKSTLIIPASQAALHIIPALLKM